MKDIFVYGTILRPEEPTIRQEHITDRCRFCELRNKCDLLFQHPKWQECLGGDNVDSTEVDNDPCCYLYASEIKDCGKQRVSEGIGSDYKIEIQSYDYKIGRSDDEDIWSPKQPVFISAQTGQGKNYFNENTLIPYVRKLNHRNKTNQKVLILSNRLALKLQAANRLKGNEATEGEEEIYSYGEYADVMTYQSLLNMQKRLEKRQQAKDHRNMYIYVICDEAHFLLLIHRSIHILKKFFLQLYGYSKMLSVCT